jgi:hypothetical protein
VGHKKRKEPSDMKLISYCFRLNSLSNHFVEIIKSILESYWHFGEKEKSKLETVYLEEEEEKQGRENERLVTEVGIPRSKSIL